MSWGGKKVSHCEKFVGPAYFILLSVYILYMNNWRTDSTKSEGGSTALRPVGNSQAPIDNTSMNNINHMHSISHLNTSKQISHAQQYLQYYDCQ